MWADLQPLRTFYGIRRKEAFLVAPQLRELDRVLSKVPTLERLGEVPLTRHDGRAYVALEVVNVLTQTPSRTLEAHRRSQPRHWPEVLRKEDGWSAEISFVNGT